MLQQAAMLSLLSSRQPLRLCQGTAAHCCQLISLSTMARGPVLPATLQVINRYYAPGPPGPCAGSQSTCTGCPLALHNPRQQVTNNQPNMSRHPWPLTYVSVPNQPVITTSLTARASMSTSTCPFVQPSLGHLLRRLHGHHVRHVHRCTVSTMSTCQQFVRIRVYTPTTWPPMRCIRPCPDSLCTPTRPQPVLVHLPGQPIYPACASPLTANTRPVAGGIHTLTDFRTSPTPWRAHPGRCAQQTHARAVG